MTSLDDLLRSVEAVFFDFDGPICSVFSGYPAPTVAADMLKVLGAEVGHLRSEIAAETDPMEVLRWTDRNFSHLVARIDDVLCAAENVAVESAAPAPSAHAAIEAAQRRGQCTAIVSNNSGPAIEKYLDTYGLTSFVDFVAGRPYADPKRMKPNPDSLIRAASALGIKPAAALLIGDTVTDIEACLVVGVRPIGYATTARRRIELANAGAAVVIGSMDALLMAR